jgi:heme oxygenase
MNIPAAVVGTNLLATLRRETHVAHATLERHPMLKAMLNGDPSIDGYVHLLMAFHDCFRSLEPMVEENLPRIERESAQYGYRWHSRLKAVRHDLDALGAGIPCKQQATVQVSADGKDGLLGVLYVLEGACQGGRVIAPLLHQRLGLDTGNGAAYFTLYRHDEWSRFLQVLQQAEVDTVAEKTVVAAKNVFAELQCCLDGRMTG